MRPGVDTDLTVPVNLDIAADRPEVGDNLRLQMVPLAELLIDLANAWRDRLLLGRGQVSVAENVSNMADRANVAAQFDN